MGQMVGGIEDVERPVAHLIIGQRLLLLRVLFVDDNEGSGARFRSEGVIDEAARVDDELLAAVRPMLATSNGRLIALSRFFAHRHEDDVSEVPVRRGTQQFAQQSGQRGTEC